MKLNFKPITIILLSLLFGSCSFLKPQSKEEEEWSNETNLSLMPANCYILHPDEAAMIAPVKGNSFSAVGQVAFAEVLWESYGTDVVPQSGDIVSKVSYMDNAIHILAGRNEGNAVIAAKDSDGGILWSWHIWVTRADLQDQSVSYGSAGTMMDRNLGALSADPTSVSSYGLLYQWGRKDPFPGVGKLSGNSFSQARSTASWPAAVKLLDGGSVLYSIKHPMTVLQADDLNYDWLPTGSIRIDATRWQHQKTIYDPCPYGWRVPDGGPDGIWSQAGFSDFTILSPFLSVKLTTSGEMVHYPFAGYGDGNSELYSPTTRGCYWSSTVYDGQDAAAPFFLNLKEGQVNPASAGGAARQHSVRCQADET